MLSRVLYSLLALAAVDLAVGSAIVSVPESPKDLAPSIVAPRDTSLDFSASTWIWADDLLSNGFAPVGYSAFRKDFIPPAGKTPVQADILITVDNNFTLYVNGDEVGTGDLFTYAEGFCVPLLSCLNVFAVTAGNLGDPGAPTPAGLLATIQITYSDGTTSTIVSDTTWLASVSVPDGYEQMSFDDSSWDQAIGEGAYGVSPWGQIELPSAAPALSFTFVNWIWTDEVVNGFAPVGAHAFRRTYTPPSGQTVASATIIITCDNEYSLYVNGVLAGSGNNWEAAQTYTVTVAPAPYVVFAVYAVNDGLNGAPTPNPAGLLAAIEVNTVTANCNCTGGGFFITDQDWKYSTETPTGFQLPGYNDSSWPAAIVEGAYGISPWETDVTITAASGPATPIAGAPASA